MFPEMYRMKSNHFVALLTTCFLLLAAGTGLFNSQTVTATDSPVPAAVDAVPVGTIFSWAGDSGKIPENWKLCDGRQLAKKKYPDLFEAIGTAWGSSGKKFNLPDLRGRFLRGVDAGSKRDPDRNKRKTSNPGGNKSGVGSVQNDSFQNHTHSIGYHTHIQERLTTWSNLYYQSGSSFRTVYYSPGFYGSTLGSKSEIYGPQDYKTKSDLSYGEESRPLNAAVHWIIKVR